MQNSALYEFGDELCCYLVSNIRAACRKFRGAADDFAECLEQTLFDKLDLDGAHSDDSECTSLDSSDLIALATATECCAERASWNSYPQLHRRAILCVPEIRERLTRADAEAWSEAAYQFAEKLEQSGLQLKEGVELVREWILLARRYLASIGNPGQQTEPTTVLSIAAQPSSTPTIQFPSAPVPPSGAPASTESPCRTNSTQSRSSGNLPAEASVAEATQILGVDKKTVIRYIKTGALEWRNAAPATSSRPKYRISMESIRRLRHTYVRTELEGPTPSTRAKRRPRRTPRASAYQPKHIRPKPAS